MNAGRVVRCVNFVDLQDAGDPVEIAKAYDKAGADELVLRISRMLQMIEEQLLIWYERLRNVFYSVYCRRRNPDS